MDLIENRIKEYQMDDPVKSHILEFMNQIDVITRNREPGPGIHPGIPILETTIRKIISEYIKNIYEELNYVRSWTQTIIFGNN